MDLAEIYQCFCDLTRLRILHLLAESPLCVCHFQDILKEPQVKISKHLAYLRARGMVVANRDKNWRIYSLPAKRPPELTRNLKCLQDCAQSNPIFARDLRELARVQRTHSERAVHGLQSSRESRLTVVRDAETGEKDRSWRVWDSGF